MSKVLQINVNRNSSTTENILQMAIELNIKILAIQEPWTIQTQVNNTPIYRSINHRSFVQILPNYSTYRPRTLFYISNDIRASIAPNSPQDPDCIIIDIIEFNYQIVNIYNATHPNIPNSIQTIQRPGLIPNPLNNKNTIILGDFNTHYPWWDPLVPQSANSAYLIDFIKLYSLNLLNNPGEGTFYRPNIAIPSVLDLTLATQGIIDKIEDWQVMPDLGSDHYGVLFTINNSSNRGSLNKAYLAELRFNTKKANWEQFKADLIQSSTSLKIKLDLNQTQMLKLDLNQQNLQLDYLAEEFTTLIVKAANNSIPKVTKSAYAKPWWNDKLKALRKTMSYFYRKVKASDYTLYKKELLDAKNHYFNLIKRAKLEHWNSFLEKEDSQSIFKAMSYTKDTNTQPIPSIYSSQTSDYKSTF
jgi:hypothetical protein